MGPEIRTLFHEVPVGTEGSSRIETCLARLRETGAEADLIEELRHAVATEREAWCAAVVSQRQTQQTLHEREEQFRSLLEAAPDPIVVVDEAGSIVLVNQQAERVFGYSRQEMLGSAVEMLMPAGFRARHVEHRAVYAAAPAVRPMHSGLFAARRKDGSEFVAEISLSPLRTGGGMRVVSAIRDVTEQRLAAERIRRSEEQFRLLVDGVKDYALFLLDAEGRIVSWNAGAERIKGYTAEEIIGKHFSICCTPEDLASGRPTRQLEIAARDGRCVGECWVVRKDGSRFRAEECITALRDADGSLRGFAEVAHDISERQKALDELAQANQRVTQIVESITDSFVAVDRDWRFTYVNDRAARQVGKSRAELIGMYMWDVFPELKGGRGHEYARRVMETGEPAHYDCFIPSLQVWFENHVYPTQQGIAYFSHDITQQKAAEAQRQRDAEALREAKESAEAANRAKDQFLAVLSHELRTPLSPVLATIILMEEDPLLPRELRDEVAVIHRNVELEARLIDDLLDVTRIARGKVQLHAELVDVDVALRETIEMCREEIGQKTLDVSLKLPMQPLRVWGDPARLRQVFWNLIKNAVKFTPSGGRIEVVGSLREGEPSGRLRIEVRDSGVGIEPEILPRLFNAFEQGGPGTTRAFGGLGLGLTISKAIVEMHGGSLSATSGGRDKGATFAVELIRAAADAGAPPPAIVARGSATDRSSKRISILFVEDNADTRRVLAQVLRSKGYQVTTAGSVREASDLLARQRVDILVSDLGLPDGSGYDIMRKARGQLKGIAVSGYGMEDDINRSLESGFSCHLTKPVKPQQLSAAISQLVDGAN